MKIKCIFGLHEFITLIDRKSDSTCECGGWKTFHDMAIEHPEWNVSGNCDNFRPYIDYKIECKNCGKRDKKQEINLNVQKQFGVLGIKYV